MSNSPEEEDDTAAESSASRDAAETGPGGASAESSARHAGALQSLLRSVPPARASEVFETLLELDDVRLERIVSEGQASPPGFWYDQDEHEWVLVLTGRACLELESGEAVELGPGDGLLLRAHERHRVAWTDPTGVTVWLAVFWAVSNGSRQGTSPTQS